MPPPVTVETAPPEPRKVSEPIAAVASPTPNLLHLMFFALALGVAATVVAPPVAAPFLGFLEGLYAISARLIDGAMIVAPYAVGCLLFTSTAGGQN